MSPHLFFKNLFSAMGNYKKAFQIFMVFFTIPLMQKKEIHMMAFHVGLALATGLQDSINAIRINM